MSMQLDVLVFLFMTSINILKKKTFYISLFVLCRSKTIKFFDKFLKLKTGVKLLIFNGVEVVKSRRQNRENLVTGYKIHFCRLS